VALDTRSPYVLDFSGSDGAKNAHYILRWVNTRGQKGPWSETVSATIGAYRHSAYDMAARLGIYSGLPARWDVPSGGNYRAAPLPIDWAVGAAPLHTGAPGRGAGQKGTMIRIRR
jgi:hypothetical protein